MESFSSHEAQRAARNVTALAISNIAAKGLLFLWQLLLARWLGEAGYGIYGTIGALLSIGAAIPEFGMGQISIRDIPNHPQDAGRYLTATLTMQPFLAVAGYIILMIASFLLGYEHQIRTLLAFAAINLLIDQLGNMCHNQLIAMEKMVIPAIISTVHILSLILMAGLALTLHGGLWGLYIASMLAGIGRTAAYWWMVWRWLKIRPSFPIDRCLARSLLIDGAPLALTTLLTLAYTHTDKLLTTALIGTKGTGNLTAGFVIVFGITELLSITVLVAVFPLMSRVYAGGMREMFNFMIEKISFFNLLVSLPIGIYMSLLAVPLASLLFGPDFTRVAGVMRILIWYTVVNMIAAVFAQALIIQHRQRHLLAIRTGGLLVNIMLNLILLPRLGVNGSATANLIAESGVLLVMLRSFDLPVEWWQRGISHLWRLALAGVGLAAVLLLIRGIHPLLAASLGVPIYLGLILISGAIAKDDWDLIYRMSIVMPGGTVIGRYWKRELV